ncbi:6514_t:CDS:2 [Cetraspora pellucida]|uniref:6514_t:CDS:1 n=1 Tax=Cetraspora pellucida TaxID=1433469 RepID=A0A9N8WCX4_9GLOM|nr:6514_t:CDS:2 [Cetraspora pellucida]
MTGYNLFIAWLKQKDRTPFKVKSVYNCYTALAFYLKEHSVIGSGVCLWDKYYFPKTLKCFYKKICLLQIDEYGDTNLSDALTSNEITTCLNYNYLLVTNNEGGNTSNLQYHNVKSRADASDTSEDELMTFSGYRSYEGIRSYSKPTDDQQLNSVASLILFAKIEEDLEEFYNYSGEFYIIYKLEEDNSNTDKV